jgi:hypothetical protein
VKRASSLRSRRLRAAAAAYLSAGLDMRSGYVSDHARTVSAPGTTSMLIGSGAKRSPSA